MDQPTPPCDRQHICHSWELIYAGYDMSHVLTNLNAEERYGVGDMHECRHCHCRRYIVQVIHEWGPSISCTVRTLYDNDTYRWRK
jgi:hypothetical protein